MVSLTVGLSLVAVAMVLFTRPRIVDTLVELVARRSLTYWEKTGDKGPLERYRRGMPLLRFMTAALFLFIGAVLTVRGVT